MNGLNHELYPAGSFVVKMAQPYKTYAWSLLDRQKYPDIRQFPGGPPVPPYDNAGWTLPLQMGVTCDREDEPFEAKLEQISGAPYPKPPAGQGKAAYFVLNSQVNLSYAVAFALLKDNAEIWRTKAKVTKKGIELPVGSFLVKNSPEVMKALPALIEKYHIAGLDIDDVADVAKAPVKFHRVGLYQSWRPSMDEGWTRYVLDDMSIPYKTIHNDDIKGTKYKKPDLRADFDVIVFADESANTIKGTPPGGGRGAGADTAAMRRPEPKMPPEYEGGLGTEGVANLKTFVEKGGILVTLNNASELAMNDLEAPARNVLQGVDRTRFFCPTSILKILVDNETSIGYGMPKEAAAMFANCPAFETLMPPYGWDRKVVAAYPEDNLLMSGWLIGENMIARKAVVVDTKYKEGRMILIGIRCQTRAQTHGTYKFLLNALLYPETE